VTPSCAAISSGDRQMISSHASFPVSHCTVQGPAQEGGLGAKGAALLELVGAQAAVGQESLLVGGAVGMPTDAVDLEAVGGEEAGIPQALGGEAHLEPQQWGQLESLWQVL